MLRSAAPEGFLFDPPPDRTLPSSWGRSNARPRRPSALAVGPLIPQVVQLGLPAFSACAAAERGRARDSVHRLGGIASRQTAWHPVWWSRFVQTANRACRASLFACRRAP